MIEIISYIGVALIISLIFICINELYRDKNMELQFKINNLKKDYDELYLDKINKLKEENIDLKKYKTLYELEISNKKRK